MRKDILFNNRACFVELFIRLKIVSKYALFLKKE